MNVRPDPTIFMPMTPGLRSRIEATVEQLSNLLDEIDGDPDLEDGGDCEPSLGWTASGALGAASHVDECEPEPDEPDLGWLECCDQSNGNRCVDRGEKDHCQNGGAIF